MTQAKNEVLARARYSSTDAPRARPASSVRTRHRPLATIALSDRWRAELELRARVGTASLAAVTTGIV